MRPEVETDESMREMAGIDSERVTPEIVVEMRINIGTRNTRPTDETVRGRAVQITDLEKWRRRKIQRRIKK